MQLEEMSCHTEKLNNGAISKLETNEVIKNLILIINTCSMFNQESCHLNVIIKRNSNQWSSSILVLHVVNMITVNM